MKEERVKYPIGEQDFRNVREGGYLYVDKTRFIETILSGGGKYYFLARPRRFGKSLFLSTLQYFFEGRRELFRGLYIDTTDWTWESYPVLHLDLNRERYAEPGLLDHVLDNLFRKWEEKYGIEYIAGDYSSRFSNIIEGAHRKTGKQVVVLVDEYDKPLVGNLNKDDNFEHYRQKLAALYSNFKSSAEHLRLVFLTGVSRFSKLSVFSDLNNINDITFDNAFADVCGITGEELLTNCTQGIRRLAEDMEIDFKEGLALLKENYDGYRFTKKESEIYNPWSLLNCLDKSEINNYWNETGFPTLIAESLKRINANLKDFFDSYTTESDLKGLDLLNPNPTALLFQTGYLTIKHYNSKVKVFQLGIPNNEVKEGLFKALLPYYVTTQRQPVKNLITTLVMAFILGDPEKAMKSLQTYFAGIDYALKMENENNFHNAFFLLIDLIGLETQAESHTSDGSIDIEIKTEDYIYIIELKYDHTAGEALRQIEDKRYSRKYQSDSRKIFEIGVEFSSKTRCIEEWKIKEI
ncbi:MAG: ATP-binding protein [Muribaculaceae bacterium]|nr:ATP-binding protein [Muribaculaceae bacterium]MDE6755064.1 ATP-binding protein [Muribaculaceae bacterium]